MSDGRMRRWGAGEEEEDDREEKSLDLLKIKDWKGKTIRSASVIRAEIGRTCSSYLCIVFEDESRGMLGLVGNGVLCESHPSADQMRMAPDFYSPEDIADSVLQDEKKKRTRYAEKKRSKLQQIERLQQDLARMEE